MGNAMITWALLALIMGCFITVFSVREVVFPHGEPINGLLRATSVSAEQGDWRGAESAVHSLRRAWDRGRFLITLNYAEEDYAIFTSTLNEIESAVRSRNGQETSSLVGVCRELWDNFRRVVPEP